MYAPEVRLEEVSRKALVRAILIQKRTLLPLLPLLLLPLLLLR